MIEIYKVVSANYRANPHFSEWLCWHKRTHRGVL